MKTCKSILLFGWLIAGLLFSPAFGVAETQTTDLWYPYAEWSFDNIQYSGNAFDIDAIATFSDGKDVGLFYDGGQTWKLRYMCTEPGTYNFSVSSGNSSLNGLSGTVVCSDAVGTPGPLVPGGPNQSLFYDPAIGQPVIPAWAMIPSLLGDKPTEAELNQWFQTHIAADKATQGAHFRGAHFPGPANRWYDHNCDGTRSDCGDSANPDPETFRRYEAVFAKLAQYNAFAHFWMFWDCQRDKCDQFQNNRAGQLRLRKYMARRWGAISNWMVGEGFDNFEDDSTAYANQWYRDLSQHMPWTHFIGMRGAKNSLSLDKIICTECNYRSFESQEEAGKMTYDRWNDSREAASGIPVFEEDRYRYRSDHIKGPKSADEQIMYMWGQAMNLGVGAIYGYLETRAVNFSIPAGYPDAWETGIRAWHQFWYATPTDPFHRFLSGMEYCNNLSSDAKGICKPGEAYVFYRDGGSSIRFDISGLTAASAPAVAVDAKTGKFYDLGYFSKSKTSWTAPGNSNWALAVGTFPGAEDLGSSGEPGPLPAPSDLRILSD